MPVLDVVPAHGPGAGHLGRCLALAQAFIAGGGRVRLAVDPSTPPVWAARYERAGCDTTHRVGVGADVVAVDDPRRPDLPAVLRARGCPVLVLDDHRGRGRPDADWVLDQNLPDPDRGPGLDAGGDDGEPDATAPLGRALVGPRYALLRPDVVAARPAAPPPRDERPRRLLVAMGGDPAPAVEALLEAALTHPDLAGLALEVVRLRGVDEVGPVLAGADVALAAAGSTTWELCALGIPAVVVAVAPDQRAVARRSAAAGATVDGGALGAVDGGDLAAAVAALVADGDRRRSLAAAGWHLVDGLGARRVATELRASALRLRPARAADSRLLWRWADDPVTRASSFRPEPIPWPDHEAWFAAKSADPGAHLWVADDRDGAPVGLVRLDPSSVGDGDLRRAEIGVTVAPERRAAGWGAPLVAAGVARAFADLAAGRDRIEVIDARVLPGNERSHRVFLAADFDRGPDGSDGAATWASYTRTRHG